MKPALDRYTLPLAMLLIASGTALAQLNLLPPEETIPEPKAVVPASGPATRSAETVLEDLLRQHGNDSRNGGVDMGSTGAVTPSPAVSRPPEIGPDGLIREGQLLQGFTARLKHDGTNSATMVITENQGALSLAPMAAVPSRTLEFMENAAGFSDPKNTIDLVFPIDAEVTQYRGKNYLFLGQPAAEMPRPATQPAPATMPDTVAGVLPQPKIEAVAPNAPEMKPILEGGFGDRIEQRTGRFVKDIKTGAEIFVLDGDGKRMLDQPLGLVPSKYLEVMEEASEYGMKPVKFKVSGQITQYRGKNYLLLRSVTIVRDMHGGIGG